MSNELKPCHEYNAIGQVGWFWDCAVDDGYGGVPKSNRRYGKIRDIDPLNSHCFLMINENGGKRSFRYFEADTRPENPLQERVKELESVIQEFINVCDRCNFWEQPDIATFYARFKRTLTTQQDIKE